MTADYLKIVWRKMEYLRVTLEMGHDFIFSDGDIMWFRDPFAHLSKEADFQIACDLFNGDPHIIYNSVNTGFMYVRSSAQTVGFYKYWFESRLLQPNQHDQDVFNSIKTPTQFWGIF
jgi:hypothetical protein